MPNTREKPIEQRLKNGAESICDKCFHGKVCRAIDNQPCIECNQFTDAHGVTVQKWIPVSERLPEPFVSVLACIPSEAPLPMVHESYIADHEAWVCILTAERYKLGEVTHWMPLPEPPKGE